MADGKMASFKYLRWGFLIEDKPCLLWPQKVSIHVVLNTGWNDLLDGPNFINCQFWSQTRALLPACWPSVACVPVTRDSFAAPPVTIQYCAGMTNSNLRQTFDGSSLVALFVGGWTTAIFYPGCLKLKRVWGDGNFFECSSSCGGQSGKNITLLAGFSILVAWKWKVWPNCCT